MAGAKRINQQSRQARRSQRTTLRALFAVLGCFVYSCSEAPETSPPSDAAGDAGQTAMETMAGLGGVGLGEGGSSVASGAGQDRGGEPSGGTGDSQGGRPATTGGGGQGVAGQGENGGEAGHGGSPEEWPSGPRLGARCKSDAQCVDARAPGMFCLEPMDASAGAAPPEGLCTIGCQTDDECQAVGAGSLCEDVLGVGTRYCIEGCVGGPPREGEAKCHDRGELACNPLYIVDTGDPCVEAAECYRGEVCLDDTCQGIISGCMPACQGDNDCEQGLYCDRAYMAGTCVEAPQTGKALGEPCTVTYEEPDECLGFCLEDAPGGLTGHCSQNCSFDYPCGFDAGTQRYAGNCVYSTTLYSTSSRGDFGYCASVCNCSAECSDPALECLDLGLDSNVFVGQGLCGTDVTEPLEQCGGGGAGAGGSAP